MRRAEIHLQGRLAGILEEGDRVYQFTYNATYLASPDAVAIKALFQERTSRIGL